MGERHDAGIVDALNFVLTSGSSTGTDEVAPVIVTGCFLPRATAAPEAECGGGPKQRESFLHGANLA